MAEQLRHTHHDRTAIVVGGGHNGLVCAAYLARGGMDVTVIEARDVLGGAAAAIEFMPGYRTAFTNSPGSFESEILHELQLKKYGLQFFHPDPTVVQPMLDGETFLGWRDRSLVDQQLDAWVPGESERYRALVAALEGLGQVMQVSLFEESPTRAQIEERLTGSAQLEVFQQVVDGSLTELLNQHLRAEQSKALMMMLALNGQLVSPDAPGSAFGLMLRPMSMASPRRSVIHDDPNRSVLRGSVGLPVGTMGAMMDALVAACRAAGVTFVTGETVISLIKTDGRVQGVVTSAGRELRGGTVVSAISPYALCRDLLGDDTEGVSKPRGSAFKIVVGLDRLPSVRGLPEGVPSDQVLKSQFRVGPSAEYIARAIHDGLGGRASRDPIMWGLIPSLTSPGIAPKSRHLLSVNVWHAPYEIEGGWETQRDAFGRRCLEVLDQHLPGLADATVGYRFMDPVQIETELNLPSSNITHGDMLPDQMFGARPTVSMNAYVGPLDGLFLAGSGSWPGGYVTGIPGRNASVVILNHLRNKR